MQIWGIFAEDILGWYFCFQDKNINHSLKGIHSCVPLVIRLEHKTTFLNKIKATRSKIVIGGGISLGKGQELPSPRNISLAPLIIIVVIIISSSYGALSSCAVWTYLSRMLPPPQPHLTSSSPKPKKVSLRDSVVLPGQPSLALCIHMSPQAMTFFY